MIESCDKNLSTLVCDAGVDPPGQIKPLHWIWAPIAAFVCGGLMSACYWPVNFHFLAWIAMVPWLMVLPRVSAFNAAFFGTILGLAFYRIGFTWLFDLYGPVGGIVVVVLAMLMGTSFYVANRIVKRCGVASMLWAVPLVFVGQEILRAEGLPLYRFAFLVLGYSQSHNLWLAQIASIGGVYFLSFLIVAFNAATAYALLHKTAKGLIPLVAMIVVTLLLAIISQPPSYDHLPRINVACVQAESFKFDDYRDLTAQAIADPAKPIFIVLPEHTVERYARNDHPLICSLSELAKENGVYICLGVDFDAPRTAQCDFDNCSVILGPDGKILLKQAKAVPVPFMADGNPARSHAIIETPFGKVGTYVCYDGTFTDIPRKLVGDLNAQLLLGPVLDVEHWPEQERRQHADMAPLRSIELRRCNVRAAGSGVSQIIDARGAIIAERSHQQGPGVVVGSIYFPNDKTFFIRYGHYFATIIGYAFLAMIILLILTDSIKVIVTVLRRCLEFARR